DAQDEYRLLLERDVQRGLCGLAQRGMAHLPHDADDRAPDATMRCQSGYGSGRNSTASSRLNIAVTTPMPRPSVSTARPAKPGCLHVARSASRMSWSIPGVPRRESNVEHLRDGPASPGKIRAAGGGEASMAPEVAFRGARCRARVGGPVRVRDPASR